ncbi:Amidohydrolase [Caulifigura coniformis]|uniref:Amidohydrolase n=1 Tax=Caulifigura coniformis TaxID=2527983 RepID=A0A517SIQ7_9PLAN|nr:amidohydrolase family protein [Caulifigura coniformis]QDT56005.1 Amidohydrolase [Caulifigura coniformis]
MRQRPSDHVPRATVASLLAMAVTITSGAVSLADEPSPSPRRIFLNEFRPVPVLKVQETRLERAKFPVVSVHTHLGPLTAAEIDEQVKIMDAANIALLVSLDGRMGPKFPEHFQMLTGRHAERFLVFVRMDHVGDGQRDDPKTWDLHKPDFGVRLADRLTEAVRQGAAGVKLTKELGLSLKDAEGRLIRPDDPRFDPLWDRAGELGVPILWHCGDPAAFFLPFDERNERWEHLYRKQEYRLDGPGMPSLASLLEARNRVFARHPKTTFICAHMADSPQDLEQLGTWLDQHPNMNVEISARLGEIGRQPYTARKFFVKYADRILFGTDTNVARPVDLQPHFRFLETWDEYFPYSPSAFPPQGFWNIYGIGLPDDVLRKVYSENAERLIPGVKDRLRAFQTRRQD